MTYVWLVYLQQVFSKCEDYCRKHSITFNASKSICNFFISEVNIKMYY